MLPIAPRYINLHDHLRKALLLLKLLGVASAYDFLKHCCRLDVESVGLIEARERCRVVWRVVKVR